MLTSGFECRKPECRVKSRHSPGDSRHLPESSSSFLVPVCFHDSCSPCSTEVTWIVCFVYKEWVVKAQNGHKVGEWEETCCIRANFFFSQRLLFSPARVSQSVILSFPSFKIPPTARASAVSNPNTPSNLAAFWLQPLGLCEGCKVHILLTVTEFLLCFELFAGVQVIFLAKPLTSNELNLCQTFHFAVVQSQMSDLPNWLRRSFFWDDFYSS